MIFKVVLPMAPPRKRKGSNGALWDTQILLIDRKTSCNVARDCDSSKRYSRKELEGQGHGVRLRRVERREAEEEYLHGDGDHQLNVNVLDLVHESHHNTATMARLAGILLMFEKRLSLSFHIKLQISGVWSLEAPFH